MKSMNLIFFGPPGVGKGTMASRVAAKYNIVHISTGDLFREESKKGTKLGKLADSYMSSGKLVPDEVTVEMLKGRISQPDCKNGFILDGFPRTIPQAQALEKSGVHIDKVINFSAEKELILKRLTGRRTCRKCGTIYHIVTMKPKVDGICDKCGGELYTRDDQTDEAITKRLKVYEEQTLPLLDYYKKKGLTTDVNGNQEVEMMLKKTEKAIIS